MMVVWGVGRIGAGAVFEAGVAGVGLGFVGTVKTFVGGNLGSLVGVAGLFAGSNCEVFST